MDSVKFNTDDGLENEYDDDDEYPHIKFKIETEKIVEQPVEVYSIIFSGSSMKRSGTRGAFTPIVFKRYRNGDFVYNESIPLCGGTYFVKDSDTIWKAEPVCFNDGFDLETGEGVMEELGYIKMILDDGAGANVWTSFYIDALTFTLVDDSTIKWKLESSAPHGTCELTLKRVNE